MGNEKNPNAESSGSTTGHEKDVDLKEIVNDELTRVSKGGPWVW